MLINKIQIRVHAAGVNSFDCYKRSGSTEFPYTPGIDSAGVITKMGKNVKNLKVKTLILFKLKAKPYKISL